MITPAAPVLGILQRIERIEGRFDARSATASPTTVPSATPFDPFGEAYEQALATRSAPAPDLNLPATGANAWATPMVANPTASLIADRMRVTGAAGALSPTAAVAAAGALAPAGVRPVGGYGKMPVPDHLAAVGNGRIPAGMLQPIAQSGHRLESNAATAWDGLVRAAAADGLEVTITDSYRPYEEQVDLVRRKGLYSQGGLAATPGTSNHGWGLAVDADVRDPKVLAWMRTNAPRFGFVEAVPREPWHWEYRPHQV